jgi:ribosomal protein S18 acetylase RimI-like enzyme
VLAPARQLSRRAVAPHDDPYLRALFADSREDLQLLPPELRDPLIDMQFEAQRRQIAAAHPDAVHEMLVADGVDVGRLVVAYSADAAHIIDITIARASRRQGIATAALQELIAMPSNRSVTLRVWSANAPARRLYEQVGFVPGGTDAGYVAMERRTAP